MKFGKFEITEYCIGAIAIIAFITIALYFCNREFEMRERTKQLEIEKEIEYIKQSNQ